MLQGPEHVGGGATCRNPHQAVAGAEASLLQILAAGFGQVFQPLRAAQQGSCPTCKNSLNELWWAAEGGRTLRRIKYPKSA